MPKTLFSGGGDSCVSYGSVTPVYWQHTMGCLLKGTLTQTVKFIARENAQNAYVICTLCLSPSQGTGCIALTMYLKLDVNPSTSTDKGVSLLL
ncbi:hypothetical protein XENTR_v10007089 [Xenopus tropicalis]|nr:hypothetical protein XENTR_v10007089 [Xenopus tropicalis]